MPSLLENKVIIISGVGPGMGQAMRGTTNLLACGPMGASAEALVAGIKSGLSLQTMVSAGEVNRSPATGRLAPTTMITPAHAG